MKSCHLTTLIDLEVTMLREVTERKINTIGFHSYMESNKQNKTKTKS